ncbi:uncharacterized protein [Acropora muricata]|uniref:uncharacterized protein isoform X3 n=1 Tax=Acropora muricata TaxID=159855 RepID=UPI0034E56FD0
MSASEDSKMRVNLTGMTKQNNFTLEVIKFDQRHFKLIMEIFRLLSNAWRYSTKKEGKYAEAEPLHRHALEIQEVTFGKTPRVSFWVN